MNDLFLLGARQMAQISWRRSRRFSLWRMARRASTTGASSVALSM